MKRTAPPRRARGFTLIEFMIAGTLGLIVLGGVLHILINSKQVFTLQKAVAEVQDSGRFALQTLSTDLERAGWGTERPVDQHIVFAAQLSENACSDGPVGTPKADCITVQYQSNQDCLGSHTADDQPVLVTNTYRFVLDTSTEADGVQLGQLQCQGSLSDTPRNLLDRVENFQVSYGVDTNDDGVANRYVPADKLLLAGNGTADIVALRVALVLASGPNALDQNRNYANEELQLLNEAGYTRTDRRLRRVFVQTIALPNHSLQ